MSYNGDQSNLTIITKTFSSFLLYFVKKGVSLFFVSLFLFIPFYFFIFLFEIVLKLNNYGILPDHRVQSFLKRHRPDKPARESTKASRKNPMSLGCELESCPLGYLNNYFENRKKERNLFILMVSNQDIPFRRNWFCTTAHNSPLCDLHFSSTIL